MPATSTTEYIIVMSLVPTCGRVSPDATVETINFGTPTGNARIALLAITVPADPPRPAIPSSRPSPYSFAEMTAAPRVIAAIARPLLPDRTSSARSSPPACATSARSTSAEIVGDPRTPTSTTSGSAPCWAMRSRRKRASSPLVSSAAMTTTVFGMGVTLTPDPSPGARERGDDESTRSPLPRTGRGGEGVRVASAVLLAPSRNSWTATGLPVRLLSIAAKIRATDCRLSSTLVRIGSPPSSQARNCSTSHPCAHRGRSLSGTCSWRPLRTSGS